MTDVIDFDDYFTRHTCFPCKAIAQYYEPVMDFLSVYFFQIVMMTVQMVLGQFAIIPANFGQASAASATQGADNKAMVDGMIYIMKTLASQYI